jgi:polyphosphate glucokinase
VTTGEVLAVDVGATSIRMARFDREGAQLGARSRRSTPYPCTPEKLIAVVAERAGREPTQWIGLGFPGEVSAGVVMDGANLTRPGGVTTPVEEDLAARWRKFDLRSELETVTGCAVRVHNDASMAALGCTLGEGRELIVTLGTGCGLALVDNGALVPVRDVGADVLVGSDSYDALLGEQGRRRSEADWLVHVVSATTALATEFSATVIHLAGGNARRISPHAFGSWSSSVLIERDEPALFGAWRACYG